MPAKLPSLNLDNIVLNENAYFYRVEKKLTLKIIKDLFEKALADKSAKKKFLPLYKNPFFDNGGVEIAKFSLLVFDYEKKPSFFKNDVADFFELKYGLFLIVEYENYLTVIKRNVSGIKALNDYVENIDYKILAHFLMSDTSKVEKVVSTNISASQDSQRKTSEGDDLRGTYSRFGASKQILNALRLDDKGDKHTISLNTSRVNSFNLKQDFKDIVFWFINVLKTIELAVVSLPKSSFVDGFALPLDFEEEISKLQPKYVLFRLFNLKDDIESQKIERIFYETDEGEEVNVTFSELMEDNNSLIEVFKYGETDYRNFDQNFKIRINKKSISFHNVQFENFLLDFGNHSYMSLNQYVNYQNNFIVLFEQFEYVYSHRKIFKDSRLLGDIENFFNVFITYDDLKSIDSEKGVGYDINSTQFKENSLFRFIEDTFIESSQVFICDDLGTEWGDFISIGKSDISFFHAKYNSDSLSATNLEEVFGQVQKNFAYLELNEQAIDYRKKRWTKDYRLSKVQTKISRIRKCPPGANRISTIKKVVNKVSADGNFRRKVYVVINFLSKKKLENSVKKLKAGNDFENKGVTLQIIWFVNSLLANANELNTEFRIICKP